MTLLTKWHMQLHLWLKVLGIAYIFIALIMCNFKFCFRNLYLGETFSSYVCVQNNSSATVKDVSVKVYCFALFKPFENA